MRKPHPNHPQEIDFDTFLDNEFSPLAKEMFEDHISQCQECASILSSLKSIFHQIDGLPAIEMRTDISPAVVGKINRLDQMEPLIKRTAWIQIVIIIGLFVGMLSIGSSDAIKTTLSDFQSNFVFVITTTITSLTKWFFAIPQYISNIDLSRFETWDYSFGNILSLNLLLVLLASSGLLWFVGNRILLPNISNNHSHNGG